MRRMDALSAAAAAGLLVGWPFVAALRAADYGQLGQTFPIIEADLLAIGERSSTERGSGSGSNIENAEALR